MSSEVHHSAMTSFTPLMWLICLSNDIKGFLTLFLSLPSPPVASRAQIFFFCLPLPPAASRPPPGGFYRAGGIGDGFRVGGRGYP